MRLRRQRPFAELVERQLDLFAADHSRSLAERDAALRAYDAATAEEAEERYGEYLDLVGDLREELEGVRDAYAATLDPEAARMYETQFASEVRRRYPWCQLEEP